MEQKTKIQHFSQLRVWQSAHRHVLEIYRVTALFPREELYGLVSQIRRAAVSVTSNIAEGFGRRTILEKNRFYTIAYASLFERENQLFVARDLGYLNSEETKRVFEENTNVQRQMNALISHGRSLTSDF